MNPRNSRPKPEPDQFERYQELRLAKVASKLEEEPDLRLALMTDSVSLPGRMLLTIAIRGLGPFEMEMPLEKFDAFKLLWLIEQQGGSVTE